jgi:hypothetical protein
MALYEMLKCLVLRELPLCYYALIIGCLFGGKIGKELAKDYLNDLSGERKYQDDTIMSDVEYKMVEKLKLCAY